MPFATTNGPFPNRIVLNCAPLNGPFTAVGSPAIPFDPRIDLVCYADGILLTVLSFSFDSANNRYLIFTSTQFNLQGVIQVVHHMPNPPFMGTNGSLGGFALIATFSPVGP
jgi:hypothetical protein